MPAKILVVDDEIPLKRLITQQFRHQIKNQEFDFVFAYNGREAIETLQADSSVDIVLVDINMPEMDGLTFLEQLKNIDETIKAVVVSAYDDMKNIRAAMNRGAFDFITKPIDFQDLEITINKTLEHVREFKEKQQKLQQTQNQLLQVNEALRESEQRLQAILDNSPTAVYLKDLEGRYILINQQTERNTCCSREQIIGKTDLEFLPQAIADQLRANDREVLHTLTPIAREEVLLMEDGVHTYISVKFPLLDTKGVPYAVCGVSTEITERKAAEQALSQLNEELDNRVTERTTKLEQTCQQLKIEMNQRASAEARLRQREQEFRALAKNAPDIIARFDRELRHLYVNPAVEPVTGRSWTEFIGKTHRDLGMPEANVAYWEEALRKIFETGQEDRIEFSFLSPNGLKHYQCRLVPELGADGNIVSVLGISRDLTDYKQALSALRESEERFRQLAENIQEVFWIASVDHAQIIYVSPAYESIWNLSVKQLYEQPRSWLDAIHSDDRDRVFALLDTSQGREYDHEYRIVRPDGSIRWIRDRCFPVKDETGQVYRLVGIAEDITVRKLAEEEISKALQREKELSELKTSFVAMTSHEFRTPLTTIQSSAELLERYRNKFSEEKKVTHLQRISTSTVRMIQMLNDILIISEAEAGKLKFNPVPMDLVKLCRNLVEDLQQIDKNQRALVFTVQGALSTPTSLPLMDEKLLRQILTNLLSNAIKYSPAGSTVQFDLICFDDKAVFRIQDQGIGIPKADHLRLFESFHRATNVGTIQGTGLGLAIVKQCVDLHKGKITVDSIEGMGTTFTVTLPLKKSTEIGESVP
jgi:PAS domain S-box-containing protein